MHSATGLPLSKEGLSSSQLSSMQQQCDGYAIVHLWTSMHTMPSRHQRFFDGGLSTIHQWLGKQPNTFGRSSNTVLVALHHSFMCNKKCNNFYNCSAMGTGDAQEVPDKVITHIVTATRKLDIVCILSRASATGAPWQPVCSQRTYAAPAEHNPSVASSSCMA